jgi:uncharacterized protein (DUF488 family)
VHPPVFTIGHSTRPLDEFVSLLRPHDISQLVDIRTVPRSRHNPQYGQEALPASLATAGIAYVHLAALGGLRPKAADSINTAWRNQSFRNYADHMQTEDFRSGLDELVAISADRPTVIMCAEAVPWRCHRSLVGDALLARGIPVLDIINAGPPTAHAMTKFAVVDGTNVTYPGPTT